MTPTLNIAGSIVPATTRARRSGELRRQLSPRGNVVSPQGRPRTIAAFGEPLTPQQVVERICGDVQAPRPRRRARLHGPARRRHARPGQGPGRGPRSSRRAFDAADPAYLRTLAAGPRQHPRLPVGHPPPRRSSCGTGPALRAAAPLSPAPAGRRLHPRRRGGLSVVAPDDGRPGAGGGRGGDRRGRAAHPVRRLQHRPARRLPRPGGHRGPPDRRRPGRGGAGVRRGGDRAGRQDRRAGQPVRRAGQAAGLRRGRHRQHRRAQRGRRSSPTGRPTPGSSPPT